MSTVGAVPNNFYPTRLKRTPSILVHWPQTPVSGFLTMICMAEIAATPITLKAPVEWETGVGRYTRSPPRLSHAVQELSSQALWCTARSDRSFPVPKIRHRWFGKGHQSSLDRTTFHCLRYGEQLAEHLWYISEAN